MRLGLDPENLGSLPSSASDCRALASVSSAAEEEDGLGGPQLHSDIMVFLRHIFSGCLLERNTVPWHKGISMSRKRILFSPWSPSGFPLVWVAGLEVLP